MGNKSKNLKKLKDNGFLVPYFIVFNITDDYKKEIFKLDKNKIYAIRSDMGVEDNENRSFAGQFLTYVNVKYEDIFDKIEKIKQDAINKNIHKKHISIIVQEYINMDYSGICFTRNPEGSLEINIEYHKGIGEEIVGGKIEPKNVKFYHWENKKSFNFLELKKIFGKKILLKFFEDIKKIEKLFKFPQDIEWGFSGKKIYFLQSRNITTISKEKYKEIKFIDNFVNNESKDNFFYEKNEISEVIQNLSENNIKLLKEIYKKNGPIYNFYKKNNIIIDTNNFFKFIGNNIFVDKEIELKNYFPSFSYFKHKYKIKIIFNNIKDIFISIKNLFFLNILKFNKKKLINKIIENIDFFENINFINKYSKQDFLKNYELIYEINFFTQKEFGNQEKFFTNLDINIFDYLDSSLIKNDILKDIKNKLYIIIKEKFNKINGNGLDIEENFAFKTNIFDKKQKIIKDNFYNLSKWKQKLIENNIEKLQFFSDLREIGRILTVLNINLLKKTDFYINKAIINNNKFYFPNIITDSFINKKEKIKFISNYDTEGRLIDLYYLKNNYSNNEKIILLVDELNPNLVKYFDKIEGIISTRGGILSHLSIMCREYKKLLIIGEKKSLGIKKGDYIYIKNGKIKLKGK